jgi:RHS repeat-associated protein
MIYNAADLRVEKQDSAGTTRFIWDGQNILAETDGSNVIQAVYTQTPSTYGNLISQRRGVTTSYYHFDGLGSTDRLTNASQTVTDTYIYDPWGSLEAATGSTVNPFRFVGLKGYYFDLDLLEYYIRARIYDPPTGMFMSQDPLALEDAAESSYMYGEGNPVNFIDPSGMQTVWSPGAFGGRSGGSAGVSGGAVFVPSSGQFSPAISIYGPIGPSGGAGGTYQPAPPMDLDSIYTRPVCNDSLNPCGGGQLPPPGAPIPEGCSVVRTGKLTQKMVKHFGSTPGTIFTWGLSTVRVLESGMAQFMICGQISGRAPSGRIASPIQATQPLSPCQPTPLGKNCILNRGEFVLGTVGPYVPDPFPWEIRSYIGSVTHLRWRWYTEPNNPFTPGEICCCNKIGFAQVGWSYATWEGGIVEKTGKWIVDKGIPYPKGSPITNNPCGSAGAIDLRDRPSTYETIRGAFRLLKLDQRFETCVICLDGIEGPRFSSITTIPHRTDILGITVYGCVKWGHSIVWEGSRRKYRYRRYIDEVPDVVSLGDSAEVSIPFPAGYRGKCASDEWWKAVQQYYFRFEAIGV